VGAGVTLLLSVGEPVVLGVPPKNCEKSGAYCSELRRISIDNWRVENAKTLADFGIID
jgi:hypothetical protein